MNIIQFTVCKRIVSNNPKALSKETRVAQMVLLNPNIKNKTWTKGIMYRISSQTKSVAAASFVQSIRVKKNVLVGCRSIFPALRMHFLSV